ncbi:MAG TPA: flagellar assembly protein T N-terminal domain-containing protein [Myxococcales bacterium]
MKNLLMAVVAALALVSSGAGAAEPAKAAEPAAQVKVIEATGEAAIVNDDEPAAKEKARDAALREAVQQAMGAYVSSYSEVKDNTLVQDFIATHAVGYVREYKIINSETKEGVVKVKVRAEVTQAEMDKDAAAIKTLLHIKKQKRVFVAITDNSTETAGSKGGAQAVAVVRHGVFDSRLRDQLRKDGFTTIDPNIAEGKLKQKAGLQAITNAQEANEIANLVGADIIVYGQVNITVTEGEVGGKIFIATARSTITITSTDSAEALADVTDNVTVRSLIGSADATSKVSDQASIKAVKDVRNALFEAWRKQSSGMAVSVTVTGVKDFGIMNAFKDLLRNQVRGVKDIASARFEKNSGSMQVTYAGSVDTLASDLQGKVFKGQTINVTKATNNTLELALGK